MEPNKKNTLATIVVWLVLDVKNESEERPNDNINVQYGYAILLYYITNKYGTVRCLCRANVQNKWWNLHSQEHVTNQKTKH